MNCFHPILVRQWYDATPERTYKTSSGCITIRSSEVIKRKSNNMHYVPCGRCVACLSRRRNDWTYRLTKEKESSSYAYFLTLTYDDKYIPLRIVDGKPYFVFNKKHVQDYLKRVRYYISELDKNIKVRYLVVSEYGSKGLRPHYHMQFFVKNDNNLKFQSSINKILESQWSFGYFQRKFSEDWNIHYVTKYCVKQFDKLDPRCIDPTFILCSKQPYLGYKAEDLIDRQGDTSMVFNHGLKQATPRIYRKKLGYPGFGAKMDEHDPRLSEKLATEFLREYKRLNPGKEISFSEYSRFVQYRLINFEQESIRRQLARQEKL